MHRNALRRDHVRRHEIGRVTQHAGGEVEHGENGLSNTASGCRSASKRVMLRCIHRRWPATRR